ncbi:MAG: L-seryl-tRNA(Sec) selenium transferase [Caldithrix sp. RBG_13_44_9]|nr:MAG: L-seryl-tRNA(Sec) selenium transferase [Caldithrix sp. RBG_13_44_9]
MNLQLQAIPSLQELLLQSIQQDSGIDNRYLKLILNRTIQKYRDLIQAGKYNREVSRESLTQSILNEVQAQIKQLQSFRLKRVINGSGIILHTNLGRAPLAEPARHHLQEVLENYCNLEIDLDSGKRGDRHQLVEEVICLITGAESALVVNNNAAAVLLVLNSLCRQKEVPVSRGELVEIGGSFRMPEVMKAGQVKMIEVGTTNKTHLQDYAEVLSAKTGGILKVHTSNYRVLGFTQSVSIEDLAGLSRQYQVPLIYDMGCGVLENLEQWGFAYEPVAREYLKAGVNVMTFSADKVLGGPQAGIIIGQEEYLRKIKKNHLLRALRCDKLTYAALEATLKIYLQPEELREKLPVAQMMTVSLVELRGWGAELMVALKELPLQMDLTETYSQMGSGALPLEKIPSLALRIVPSSLTVNRLAKNLRLSEPAVIGYIENERYYLNLRTIRKDEISLLVKVIRKIFSK